MMEEEVIIENPLALNFPLSSEQRAVLSAMSAAESSPGVGLTQTLVIEIEGQLNEQRLRDALNDVVHVHDVLRYAFHHVAGYHGLRQRCLDELPPLGWQRVDLRGADNAVAALDKRLDAEQVALAIEQGQLLHATLIQTDENHRTLVLAVCPLVADRLSLQTLFNEIATAYASQSICDAAEVFQYSQFVAWRQDLAGDDDARQGQDYWTHYLQGTQELAALQVSYRHGGERAAGAGQTHAVREISHDLFDRIAEFGANAEPMMQAIWWLLLARITDCKRFFGGWQHDCRHDYEVMHGAVGVFDKVLPIVVDIAADESFSGWRERLAGRLNAHTEAQEYWSVDAPPVRAHLAVGFAFTEAPKLYGVDPVWRVRELPGPMPDFELAMQVAWGEDHAELSVYFDPSCYTQCAAERLLEQYLMLLTAALDQPTASVSALPLVGSAEKKALLAMNVPSVDFGTRTVTEQIVRWAKVTPSAPAIESDGRSLSYAQFIDQANRMARWMQAQGVGRGMLVALNLPRSSELLVAMLAAWRVGAGYLPLEPEWPTARQDAVLAAAKPALVLHATSLTDNVTPARETQWREVSLSDIDLNAYSNAHPTNVDSNSLRDIAYVLFTSGSTGTPKGVVIEQGQLLNYVAAASAAMDLGACRRWALTGSVTADLGNTALFGALFNGACLVIAKPEEMQDGETFSRFMSARAIDGLKMVPSHLEALLESDTSCLPCKLVLGGEAASPTLIERIRQLAPDCDIYNHYGPAETTVGVMIHAFEAQAGTPGTLPLTTVLANNCVYVLDDTMHLTASGALGEVYIGGDQLCRSYLNQAMDGVLVADPLQSGAYLYGTGDLAYVLPEGGIRLAGRADHQIKIRGFRIEPAEVESALLAEPGVRQVAVIALSTGASEPELTAFLVANTHRVSKVGQQQLRDSLAAVLPTYMLPTRYLFVTELPRLTNDKIDRLALADLAVVETKSQSSTPARDVVEWMLVTCMAKLLKRETIGVEDDFFELGGHSLLVIKLVARLRKLLKVEIAPGVVFDHPTAAELAVALRSGDCDIVQLERLAEAQRQLAALSPGERAALEQRARQGKPATEESIN